MKDRFRHNNRHLILVMLLIVVISIMGCSFDNESAQYQDISPQEAKKQLDSGADIILLDVRTPEEYAESHIPGSILIPVDDIEKEAPIQIPDKDATIFVYCRSGRRSVTASVALVKMGYRSVYNLGGIIDWPYETVK